jgi:hypothetical protein
VATVAHDMTHPNGQARSTSFVTVLAWILISFTGLGAAGTLLQTVAVNIMLSLPDMRPQAAASDGAGSFLALRILPAALFLFLGFTFACAVAFLKRRDWARRIWVVLFALGIAFHAVALALFLLGAFFHSAPSSESDERFLQMLKLIVIPMALGALGISALFGWLIKRLLSADVRREFARGVAT